MAVLDFLAKEHTIARPTFNRWLVPPAALAIHLCIGMAYGFSVFWIPLQQAIGITTPKVYPAGMSFFAKIVSTNYDWEMPMLGWMYTLFFVFLGSSAAIWGGWLEHAGPRKAGVVSALCWCGGLVISAIGVYLHQIWMLWIGSGVIGGIGLGLGYISPVSTLIKWFPDRRGMATGMAIMGFGGGAMIGAPLADRLMKHYATSTSVGVWETFLTLAAIYFVFMMAGALSYRVPPTGWKPEGWTPPSDQGSNRMITTRHVHLEQVCKTPQFWLLWGVLCLNVSATIGVIGVASKLLQEVFGGTLIGIDTTFDGLTKLQKGQIAAIGAGFTGLLSLFNIGGRFAWASFSDYLGRKATYFVFFVLGVALYALIPSLNPIGNALYAWFPSLGKHVNLALFVGIVCVAVSMYGGGFAAIPAYLADIFGTQMVGAIHGRLLTAWATAGVLGPVLVNYIHEYQIKHGVSKAHAYDSTMYILAGLLALGFFCNLLVRPVASKWFMTDEELANEKRLAHERAVAASVRAASGGGFHWNPLAALLASEAGTATNRIVTTLAWSAVCIPLTCGVWITVEKAITFFR